ncbi:thioredoxin [Octadecabacter temperatus]|uniref:Thioredoxin n=1 Tax=Octadecabacter temperatus TaxID=1458307 RepID=A0A0K0Y9L1_9RHOB|nr:thioredoxin [Octadecabacter temperatus]AKS47562.1 Thioredoxin-1 [Octadecabacter temperatus]SIO41239.1 thioredoxin [Octadecabacter temperatus]
MIELGGGQQPAAANDLVKDVSEDTFMQDVVEASNEVPIIVDFWAAWCGPCKTLGPMLEEAVKKAGGRVKMVKVDVDQNQAIAGQLQIQSLPTVYAFFNGKPVDGFQGALPASEVEAFVNKIAEMGPEPDNGLDDAVEAAETMLTDGEFADAVETFSAILEEDNMHAGAAGGLIRAHLALEDLEQAEAVVNGVPAEIHDAPEVEAARAALELAKQAVDAGPVAELTAAVEADGDNHQARLDLAVALHASGDSEGAVDQLLEIFRRDREWNDGAAKAQLFTVFDALKPTDPVVLNGRRKLSSMIFA